MCSPLFENIDDGRQTLIMRGVIGLLLYLSFRTFLDLWLLFLCYRLFWKQASQSIAYQSRAIAQVAPCDKLALGMGGQPTLAVLQQLLHFIIANPVVLIIVQYWNKHVDMGEQVAEEAGGLKRHAIIAAGSPVRIVLI